MMRKGIRFLVLALILGIFLISSSKPAVARWIERDDTYIDPVKVCQDGIYMGVATVDPEYTNPVKVTANIYTTQELLFEKSYMLTLQTEPNEFLNYYEFVSESWYQSGDLLEVGTKVILGGGSFNPIVFVDDCTLEPVEPTGISYQGYLTDGDSPASGTYDLNFTLYEAPTGGSALGAAQEFNNVSVEEGLFTVLLSFDHQEFSGGGRWLGIGVRPGGSSDTYTDLSPRQALSAVPYALNVINIPKHDHLGETWYANYESLEIIASAESFWEAPIVISNTYGSGLAIDFAESGIYVNDSVTGIEIRKTGTGVYVASAAYDGFAVANSDGNGLDVSQADWRGVNILSAGQDGVFVDHAGNPSIKTTSSAKDGIEIAGAEGNGVYVGWADGSGVRVEDAAQNGYYTGTPAWDGLWVSNAGDDGVDVDGTNYAGAFFGPIYVSGGCSGCTLTTFGINTGDQALQPGDIVSVLGTQTSQYDGAQVLANVTLAAPDQALFGVVQGRAELDEVENPRPGQMSVRLVPREGSANPGEFVTVIIYGIAQVRANSGSNVETGTRLALDTSGLARPLQTVELNGVQLQESAPTLGTALDAPDVDGLVWVLVNPQ